MTDRIKGLIGFIALAIVSFSGYSTSPDSLARRLEYQTLVYPQEKVYVATDKNVYVAGDTIRFRAFLVDALKLTPQKDGSKYVYLEVIDPFGNKIKKIKVKEKKGMFAGIVPLTEDLPEGTYTLGAYTLFMKNQGEDFIFRKPLPILSQMAKKYKMKTEFDGNILQTSLSEHFSEKPARAFGVSLYSKDGILRDNVKHRSNFNFTLSPKAIKEDVLMVKYDLYEKFIRIPKDTSSFIVTFHPEGGYVIPGVVNKIAFKALGSDGLSKEVTGKIVSSKGEKVCDIKSVHKGMGTFEFIPQENETYQALIADKSFELPVADNDLSVLRVDTNDKDSVAVKVIGNFFPGLVLIADNCGVVTFANSLDKPELKLSRQGLGSGLIQLYLFNPNDDIISSRLIFNRTGYIYNDSTLSLPMGDYAVTSRRKSSDAFNTHSIVSEFMLQGDIRGHIEEPDYYFTNVDSIKDRNLDNLMLTQGWKRYDIQKAVKGNFEAPKEPMEIGGELTGTVYSRWKGKPLQGATVNVMSPEMNFGAVAETDSAGRYYINGVDWPDGTYFAVQAFNKNGNKEHNLVVDQDVAVNIKNLPENYSCDVYDPKMFDNGAVWLQEVEVSAPLSADELHREMLRAMGVRTFTAENIKDNNYTNYEEIIRKIPGLNIINGNLVNMATRGALSWSRANEGLVEFWVDGFRWHPNGTLGDGISNTFMEFSQNYPLHILESLEYYKPSVAMFISGSAAQGAGALVVKTKEGSAAPSWDYDLFIKRETPLGYQNLAEAYEPHFVYDPIEETPTVTSYWYPRISGLDEIDPVTNSDTVIEGITDMGLPYRGVIKAKDIKE